MPPQSKPSADGTKPSTRQPPHVRALSDRAYHRFQRGVWAICIVVYLAVFIGGIQAGGSELLSLGRAVGFTLLAAVLGRTALGLLGRASVPGEPVPMAVAGRKVDSLVDLLGSTNVDTQEGHDDEEDESASAA